MVWGRISVTPGFWLLMAWLYYSDQGRLAVLALLASGVHELAHCVCLRLFGAEVKQVRITAVGAEMTVSGRLNYFGEFVTAAAGPLSNILMARLAVHLEGERSYLFAGVNLTLAIFNLLPVSGLDGGRCLGCLGEWVLGPRAAYRLCRVSDFLVVAIALVAGSTAFFCGKNMTAMVVVVWLCCHIFVKS